MKALLRKTARTMADWPGVGRLVKIVVAVIRLPEFRDRLERDRFERERMAVPEGYRIFETEQLPTLLQTVSDLNRRQMLDAQGQANLMHSVPVSLRKLTREIVQLREQNQQLKVQMHELVESQARNLTETDVRGLVDGKVHGLEQSVQYLLNRVEFVRRELMFEMRYGAKSPNAEAEQMTVKAEILDAAKVEQARQSDAGIRLNLGCGHVPLPGYLNVDRRALPGVDVVAEVDHLPFAPGEVAEICSAHMLEHFPQEQLRRELLPYWVSLLRSNGVFRAIVPDGAGMARAFATQEYVFDRLREVTFGGQDYDGDFHYNMFSVDSLSEILREAGFTHIEVVAENRENGGCKEFEIVATR